MDSYPALRLAGKTLKISGECWSKKEEHESGGSAQDLEQVHPKPTGETSFFGFGKGR